METNTLVTKARDEYQARPYNGGKPEYGFMSGGCAATRDADPLELSNHRTAAKWYQDAGVEVEFDHFGHWAVGWIDYLTVPISRAAVEVLERIDTALSQYPVLDDEDFSETEWEANHPDDDDHCYDDNHRYEFENYGESPCGRVKF
jgi:hypothetical protein